MVEEFYLRILRREAVLLSWIVVGVCLPPFGFTLGFSYELADWLGPGWPLVYRSQDAFPWLLAGVFFACWIGLAVRMRRRYTVAVSDGTITVGQLRRTVTLPLDEVQYVHTSAQLAHPILELSDGRSVTIRCLQQSMFPTQRHRAFLRALRAYGVELVGVSNMSRWRGRQLEIDT